MKDLVVQYVGFYEANKLWKMGFAAEKTLSLTPPVAVQLKGTYDGSTTQYTQPPSDVQLGL